MIRGNKTEYKIKDFVEYLKLLVIVKLWNRQAHLMDTDDLKYTENPKRMCDFSLFVWFKTYTRM